MAGIDAGENLSASAMSGLARRQYGALARMRWQMFKNGMRSSRGVFEAGARTVSYLMYVPMGLGLGAGMGTAAYFLIAKDQWPFFPLLLWVVFAIWQIVPVAMASFGDQFDLGVLLRFPVSFHSFFLLYVLFGLMDISTWVGGLCTIGLGTGITVARPALFGWAALGLAIFAAFNILLARAIFAWIDRWLAQRRTREIVAAVFLVLVLGLQLLNPALQESHHASGRNRAERAAGARKIESEVRPWLRKARVVQNWLPPGLAAQAMRQADEARPAPAWGSLGVLGLYLVAAGGVLAARLKAEYRGENLGEAPASKKVETRESVRQWGGSGPIAMVMEKEYHALMRTLPLLYAAGAPLLLTLVFSGLFKQGAPEGHVFQLALPVCMVYAQLGFTQLFYNNLGTEGTAIQLYFLAPTPIRTVILAKNLFHSMLFGLVALLAGIMTGLRLGMPSGVVTAATVAWLLFSLPCNLAAGNLFSLTMPYRVNPGRISRQRGSQANALLSLVVQLGVMAVGAAVFALSWSLDRMWLAVPIFLALAAAAVTVWLRGLRNADSMANARRDTLIEKLAKTE